jgi:hypothetical protein
MKTRHARLSTQKGTETVEFAITSALLFLLLFGIIEFSVAMVDRAILANASREGCRVGILYRAYWDTNGNALPRDGGQVAASEDPLIESAVLTYAQNYLISPGGGSSLTADDITITRNLGADGELNVGDSVSVRVEYDFAFFIVPRLLGDQLSEGIPAETIMFAE